MSVRPWRDIVRRKSRQIMVGTVPVGGDAPVTVQTMTNTPTSDARATIDQIRRCEDAGVDIIRVSCPDVESTAALKQIVRAARVPIVADIHFHYKRALEAADAGAACLRINPGNIGSAERVQEVINAAKANVVSARAQLSSAQTQRVRAIIRSPVTGVVLARQVDPGQTVAASFNTPTLFVIAQDLSQMKLEVAIDEADVGQVKQGQDATFTVDAFPGKTFPAKITRVEVGSNQTVSDATSSSSSTTSSSTTGQVVSYAADLSVANPDEQLRPGMTATADIVTMSRKNVLLVPNAALRFTPASDATPSASESGGITGALMPRRRRNTL